MTVPITFTNVGFPANNPAATLNGTGSLTLSFDTLISIRAGRLQTARWVPQLTGALNLTITTGTSQNFANVKIPLATLTGKPILTTVGGIPVVFTPKLDIYATVGGNIKAGVSVVSNASVSVGAGVEYNQGSGWRPVTTYSKTINLTPTLNSYATASFNATPLGVNFSVLIDDVAGPELTLDLPKLNATLTAQTNPPTADVDVTGDFDGEAGFHAQILSLSADYTTPPLDYHFDIYHQQFGSNGGGTGAAYSITDLGTLPGYTGSVASSINSAGQVVGGSVTSSTVSTGHAFLWQSGQMRDLGILPGDTGSVARGINSAGQVVGGSYSGNGTGHAFLWQNNQMQNLGVLSGGTFSNACGINSAGQVVGDSFTSNSQPPITLLHAFLWQSGQMQDLGTLPGDTGSIAHGINSAGQVVGEAFGNSLGTGHAFLWQNDQMQDLGTLPGESYSTANGINNAGQVVGYSTAATDGGQAFLWQSGQMQDLNTLIPANSGWALDDATGINDRGQICGDGIRNNQLHAFLLTPTASGHAR